LLEQNDFFWQECCHGPSTARRLKGADAPVGMTDCKKTGQH
jgi:hypothetical protein